MVRHATVALEAILRSKEHGLSQAELDEVRAELKELVDGNRWREEAHALHHELYLCLMPLAEQMWSAAFDESSEEKGALTLFERVDVIMKEWEDRANVLSPLFAYYDRYAVERLEEMWASSPATRSKPVCLKVRLLVMWVARLAFPARLLHKLEEEFLVWIAQTRKKDMSGGMDTQPFPLVGLLRKLDAIENDAVSMRLHNCLVSVTSKREEGKDAAGAIVPNLSSLSLPSLLCNEQHLLYDHDVSKDGVDDDEAAILLSSEHGRAGMDDRRPPTRVGGLSFAEEVVDSSVVLMAKLQERVFEYLSGQYEKEAESVFATHPIKGMNEYVTWAPKFIKKEEKFVSALLGKQSSASLVRMCVDVVVGKRKADLCSHAIQELAAVNARGYAEVFSLLQLFPGGEHYLQKTVTTHWSNTTKALLEASVGEQSKRFRQPRFNGVANFSTRCPPPPACLHSATVADRECVPGSSPEGSSLKALSCILDVISKLDSTAGVVVGGRDLVFIAAEDGIRCAVNEYHLYPFWIAIGLSTLVEVPPTPILLRGAFSSLGRPVSAEQVVPSPTSSFANITSIRDYTATAESKSSGGGGGESTGTIGGGSNGSSLSEAPSSSVGEKGRQNGGSGSNMTTPVKRRMGQKTATLPPHLPSRVLTERFRELFSQAKSLKSSIIVRLLKMVDEKDAFEAWHLHLMCRRLLFGTVVSIEAERDLATSVDSVCEYGFKSQVERIFLDVRMSEESKLTMDSTEAPLAVGVRFSPIVMSPAVWPLSGTLLSRDGEPARAAYTQSLPFAELERVRERYTSYFKSTYQSRQCQWVHKLSRYEVDRVDNLNVNTLLVSFAQMYALLKLNETSSITIADMEEELEEYGLSKREVRQSLASLWQAGVLRAASRFHEQDAVCPDTDVELIPELNFYYPKRRVRLFHPSNRSVQVVESTDNHLRSPIRRRGRSQIFRDHDKVEDSIEEEEVAEYLSEDRKVFLQSVIVRIMKKAKQMSHSTLVEEATLTAQTRYKAKVSDIKNTIDTLLSQQYIRRDNKDANKYVYVS